MPERVWRCMGFFLVTPLSWRNFATHRVPLPHIMASEPSLLKIRMEKSASGRVAAPMRMSPSLPMPKCGRLHLMAAAEGAGILYNNVLT